MPATWIQIYEPKFHKRKANDFDQCVLVSYTRPRRPEERRIKRTCWHAIFFALKAKRSWPYKGGVGLKDVCGVWCAVCVCGRVYWFLQLPTNRSTSHSHSHSLTELLAKGQRLQHIVANEKGFFGQERIIQSFSQIINHSSESLINSQQPFGFHRKEWFLAGESLFSSCHYFGGSSGSCVFVINCYLIRFA